MQLVNCYVHGLFKSYVDVIFFEGLLTASSRTIINNASILPLCFSTLQQQGLTYLTAEHLRVSRLK